MSDCVCYAGLYAYVSFVLCVRDRLRKLLLDDVRRRRAAEIGIGDENFGDTIESGKV